MTPSQLLVSLPELQKQFGSNPVYMNYLMRQCHQQDKNFNPNLYYFYGISQNPTNRAQIDSLGNALQTKTSESLKGTKITSNDLFSAIQNNKIVTTLKAGGVTGKALEPAINTATQYAAYQIGNGVNKDTAITNAQQLFFTGQYNVDTLGGTSYLIPAYDQSNKPTDVNTIHDLLKGTVENHIFKNDIDVPSTEYLGMSEADRKENYRRNLIDNFVGLGIHQAPKRKSRKSQGSESID